MKNNKFEIEKTILRIFLKHVKAKKLYLAFRLAVNNNGRKDLFHVLSVTLNPKGHYAKMDRLKHYDSVFLRVSSLEEMIVQINAMLNGKRIVVDNNPNFQMMIMNIVNTLIHSCIEYYVGNNIGILEELGSSIFEETCRTLLGDSFQDVTEEAIDPRQREFLNKMDEYVRTHGGMPPFDTRHSLPREFIENSNVMLRRNDNLYHVMDYYKIEDEEDIF